VHRSLGVHVSFVRSATMDTWTAAQFAMMRAGGNDKQKKFFDKYGVAKSTPAREKYNTDVAVAYREKLKANAEGREWKKPKGLGKGERRSIAGQSSSSSSRRTSSAVAASADAAETSAKKHSSRRGNGAFDLATGTGSLLTTAYVPNAEGHEDGWRPPSPRPPRGAIEGRFLMGLSPQTWVSFLKKIDRQDDRAYHLRKMSADERSQVVAVMSGAPPPPMPAFGRGDKHDLERRRGTKKKEASIASVDPFGDASGASAGARDAIADADSDSDDDRESLAVSGKTKKTPKKPKKKKDWDESSDDEEETSTGGGSDDDVDLRRRAAASLRDGGGAEAVAKKRAERERRERAVAESAAREREKAERKELRRREKARAAVQAAEAAAMMEAKLRASAFSQKDPGMTKTKTRAGSDSARRPPEVGGFPGIPGMEHVLPGPPPPAGARLGSNTYVGFGNPAIGGGGDGWMGGAQRQTEGMLGQAKGWLSGALKTMAERLDGAGSSSGGGGGVSFGIQGGPMAEAEAARQRKQWEDAQRGLFLDDRHVGSRGGKSGLRRERGAEARFYDETSEASGSGSEPSGSSSSSDDVSLSPRTRQRNLRKRHGADDPANAFAASIKGLANGFGGQANLGGFYSDED